MLLKAPISSKQQSVFLEKQGCFFRKGVIQFCLNPLPSKAYLPGVIPDYFTGIGFSKMFSKGESNLEQVAGNILEKYSTVYIYINVRSQIFFLDRKKYSITEKKQTTTYKTC